MKDKLKKLKTGFLGLPKKKKVELVAAIILSCSLIVSVPATAWFGYQRRIVKLQKINSPNTLILTAAHCEDTMCFNIDGIDADEKVKDGNGSEITPVTRIDHKDYVFCVTGDVSEFTIQLAYTTNNPFTYEVFAADEFTTKPAFTANSEVPFVEYSYTGNTMSGVSASSLSAPTTLYYTINTTISDPGVVAGTGKYTGNYLKANATYDDATNSYHVDTYSNYTELLAGNRSQGYSRKEQS